MDNRKPKTILIGMPCASGQVPTTMVQSLLQLHKPYPCAFMTVDRQRVEKARNAIVMEALKTGADYLFFVDDDNPIPPNTLEVFIEDDKDIILAPILSRNPSKDGKYKLCAFYAKEIKVAKENITLYYEIENFRDKGPLHEIDAGGSGCILIKRKVLEELYKKYQDEIYKFNEIKFKKKIKVNGQFYDRRSMGEDVEFAERARKLGFEVWLDDRIRPFHITTFNLIQWNNGSLGSNNS